MKQLLTTLLFLHWLGAALASDTTIVFRQANYAELFDLAKKENKGVMLYFHFDGCGACVKMEKTAFKDKGVYEYFNSKFINYDINTLKGDGIEINKIYNVQMHPTFLFFDAQGNELHKMVGVFTPEEFYKQANNALISNKNLANYRRLYQEGNREPDFLFDYVYMLRDANELDSATASEYFTVVDKQDYSLERNIGFIYEFSIHKFNIFFPYGSPQFDFLFNNKDLFYEHFDSSQVKTRIVWILNSAIYKAIEDTDEPTLRQALELLKEYDTGEYYMFKEMDGRTTGVIMNKNLVLTSLLSYYKKIDDKPNYTKTLDALVQKNWDNADELNSFAWGVFENSPEEDTDIIQTAIKCSTRSIELEDNYANNDTYAWLLYKSGQTKNAVIQARKTIEIAKKENKDFSETQKLIDLVEGR